MKGLFWSFLRGAAERVGFELVAGAIEWWRKRQSAGTISGAELERLSTEPEEPKR